ncbi:MAG: glutaredoxin family protein [Gemmataceae bacterium]|nr:glutaredoxin family protein [Gemmataceae bacterium]
MEWLWPSWLRRRRAALAHVNIVLYARPGCHPCDDAKSLLENRRRHWGFQFEVRNVDNDATQCERYGNCVPVVVVDEKVRFRGRVEPVLLDRLLRGAEKK